jgi:hypothetical protein
MKFGNSVLLEIVDLVRKGLIENVDISQLLREIDVVTETKIDTLVELSGDYIRTHPRASVEEDQE